MNASRAIAWIVDDDRSIRWVLQKALEVVDITVRAFETGDIALNELKQGREQRPDVLISDIRMPGIDGLELLSEIKERYPELPVIIMTAYSDLDSAVSVYEGGAFEYLPKPFDVDEAVELVQRAISHSREQNSEPAENVNIGTDIVGEGSLISRSKYVKFVVSSISS